MGEGAGAPPSREHSPLNGPAERSVLCARPSLAPENIGSGRRPFSHTCIHVLRNSLLRALRLSEEKPEKKQHVFSCYPFIYPSIYHIYLFFTRPHKTESSCCLLSMLFARKVIYNLQNDQSYSRRLNVTDVNRDQPPTCIRGLASITSHSQIRQSPSNRPRARELHKSAVGEVEQYGAVCLF